MPKTHLPRPVITNPSASTGNWSGYADVGCSTCSFRYVTARFSLPSVNCATVPDGSYAAYWVGLDGFNTDTVEQTGVDTYCSSGIPGYYAWYEMYPLAPVPFTGVNPGDAISVSVYYNSTTRKWQLSLNDLTTGGSLSSAQACPPGSVCKNADAEVITEAPGSVTLPLADFGQSSYEAIGVTSLGGTHGNIGSNSLWTSYSLTMVSQSGNRNLAVPGPVYGGQAFQVSWNAAQ